MNKSYLKWAGGKSRILDSILPLFPETDTFIEPFAGSCVVSLNFECEKKILNDLNGDLINTHKHCKENPGKVLKVLEELYNLGREKYYELREEFNNSEQNIRKAALFIYLNKHGYNGMCRYNSSGGFNIPVGKSKTIHFPIEEIKDFSKNIGECNFLNEDFLETMDKAQKGSVVYCDPPYVPVGESLSEINYTKEGFPFESQVALKEKALELKDRGVTTLISNHDTPVTRGLYEDADEIIYLEAFRSISSKERGKVGELVAIYKGCDN